MKKCILFVDDSPQILDSLRRMLRRQESAWSMAFVQDSAEAWQRLQSEPFDAVVSDVKMPGITGLQLLERVKSCRAIKDVAVVMITGLGDRNLKRRSLELGAADLLNKPLEAEDLIARLRNVLRLKEYEDQLRNQNAELERKVRIRTAELYRSRLDVVWRLGKAAEHRDNETGNHVIRVGCMCRAVAERLGMDHRFVETIFVASPLHDIGKVGIPDAILLKNGPLSQGERQAMTHHCWIGERILREPALSERLFDRVIGVQMESETARQCNPLIEMAATIALTHHEKWDGSGYPQALVGDAIPIESRITAIADVFDALTSQRPYKPAFSEDRALAILRQSAGEHFDPAVHSAFQQALPELRSIREELCDGANQLHDEEPHDAPDPVCR